MLRDPVEGNVKPLVLETGREHSRRHIFQEVFGETTEKIDRSDVEKFGDAITVS